MRRALVGACLVLCTARVSAQPSAQLKQYDDLVRLYRSGSFERASSELRFLSIDKFDEQLLTDWARAARREERRDDLAAALMMHTEVIFDEVAADPTRLRFNLAVRKHDRAITAIHQQLHGFSRNTPLLRTWYLMWEAFRQGFSMEGNSPLSDYLDDGLNAFPDDSDMLLSAGGRNELTWWNAAQNPQRDPSDRSRAGENLLNDARRYLQKSVDANPKAIEARIRLGRVLMLLGRYDAAGEQLTGPSQSGQPAFEYLRLLFLGDLRERQNDPAGAIVAYEEAIGLTPSPQSARLAVAEVSHSMGRRTDAARVAIQAMSTPSNENDPWWGYQRGQWWRLGYYLKVGRGLVVNARGSTR
jgi:hypothetical protein